MKKLRRSRPSPALIISILALVLALGGTAIAATGISGYDLRPQTVGGGKLRQFTGGLLRRQSLGGGKLKPNSVTGYQIEESSLSTVPSANQANSAASVAGDTRYSVKLSFGQSQTLASVGPLTLTGQCIQNGTDHAEETGRDIARVLISTSEAGSYFQGSTESGPLGPTTPEGKRVAMEYTVPTGGSGFDAEGLLGAYAPNGSGLLAPAGASDVAIGMFGSDCPFDGAVFKA